LYYSDENEEGMSADDENGERVEKSRSKIKVSLSNIKYVQLTLLAVMVKQKSPLTAVRNPLMENSTLNEIRGV